jgi:predicted nucleic acid-binding protein
MEIVAAVSDTGPLVALAKIDKLDLLTSFFATVLIPPGVEHEVYAKQSLDRKRLEGAIGQSIQVSDRPVVPAEVLGAVGNLDLGETEAIALAYNKRVALVMDEVRGRKAAMSLGLPVIGTVGIVLESKRRGILPAAKPVLLQLRTQGYWLSDSLIAQAAALVAE